MRFRLSLNLLLVITLFMAFSHGFADGPEVFRIPRIVGLTLDGSENDWGTRGFRVEIVTDPDGQTLPAEDFDVKFRLAWDQEGLYVLAVVRDDIAVEHENVSRLWRTDCVELFVSEYLVSASPSLDRRRAGLRLPAGARVHPARPAAPGKCPRSRRGPPRRARYLQRPGRRAAGPWRQR